jgi:Predicted membrane protein
MKRQSINWKKRLEGREAGRLAAQKAQARKKPTARAAVRTEPQKHESKAAARSMAPEALRRMVILAMLVAMEIVLNRFLSINTAGWKIGFAFIPPTVAAILYGPVESAIVYALADFLGAILFPIGTYHPGFTICAAVMGIIAGIFLCKRPFALFRFEREWKKIRFFPNIIVPVLINCLLIGLIVNTLWVAQLYGSRTYGGWFLYRLPEYAVMVPVQLILIPALLKLCKTLKKVIGEKTGKRKKAVKA